MAAIAVPWGKDAPALLLSWNRRVVAVENFAQKTVR
jgi:hypothetical protein